LEETDTSELMGSGWRAPEPCVAKGRDGLTDIYGVVRWPKNFDPKKKYPVLEDIYAGPHGSFVPKRFEANNLNQSLTDHGFIVVQIDGMGTSNRSKKFHDVCWKNLQDSGFPDRIAWISWI
jgi:dipeptidyl aminopeptidase/acylaminoacyl peptidase